MIKAVLFDYGLVLFGLALPDYRVKNLAKELRARSIRTAILTNMFPAAAWLIDIFGGFRGFEPRIFAFKEKVAKPDPRIYKIAAERIGVEPGQIIFVDNLEVNVKAAKGIGMKIVLAKNSKQVVNDIKQ